MLEVKVAGLGSCHHYRGQVVAVNSTTRKSAIAEKKLIVQNCLVLARWQHFLRFKRWGVWGDRVGVGVKSRKTVLLGDTSY